MLIMSAPRVTSVAEPPRRARSWVHTSSWPSVAQPLALAATVFAFGAGADAATVIWKGHTWQLTSGGMAGVCQGDPNNVTVDSDGYLHLRIANGAAGWTDSELFTTDLLGFGTYQWQVDGPIDAYDKNVVFGLFPYGPAAGIGSDGTNEIDIEYSRWGKASGPNGDWTDYPASGTAVGELSYSFSLAGATLSTSRFVWSSTTIADALLSGLQPVDGVTGLIKTWTYAPPDPTVNIPQQALPLGMNLWCFNSPPSDGNPVEIVVRDFVFLPPSSVAGTGGAGVGGGGTAGAGGAGAGGGGTAEAGGFGGSGGTHGGGQTETVGEEGSSGGASGETGSAVSLGGNRGNGGTSAHGGFSAGEVGTVVSAGARGTPGGNGAGESIESGGSDATPGSVAGGTTASAGAGGTVAGRSSSGCAFAFDDSDAPRPATAVWPLVALMVLERRSLRRALSRCAAVVW